MRLEPLLVWFQPAPGALLPQLDRFLAAEALRRAGCGAELLRWAITAVEPGRGLRIEGVLVAEETAHPALSPPATRAGVPG